MKLCIMVAKMEKSGVRTPPSLTARSSRTLPRGVIQGYCSLECSRRLKVVLLSGTMGVLGAMAAHAGSPGLPLGANPVASTEMAAPAGSVAAQAIEECKPWDIACLLLRPVGTVPAGPPSGDRGQDGGPGDDDDGGEGPPGDPPGDPPGEDPPGEDPPGDGNNGPGNGDSNTNTGQDGLAETDPSNPGQGGGFGINGGGNAGGGNPPDHE